jgi:hypothetical protein
MEMVTVPSSAEQAERIRQRHAVGLYVDLRLGARRNVILSPEQAERVTEHLFGAAHASRARRVCEE